MSTHIVRKPGIIGVSPSAATPTNPEVHNLLDETRSEDSDNEVPETKNQYFEFTNGYHIMRLIRVIFFVQALGLLIDNPATRLSILYDTFCRGISFYSLHFHSRPFLDIIYIIQLFYESVKNVILSQHVPSTPGNIVVTTPHVPSSIHRRLNINPYASGVSSLSSTSQSFGWKVDSLNDHNFHTMKFYSHYFLTIMFVIAGILFIIRFWEINDYSNREEVKFWLGRYIADGWWRKGGLNIAVSITVISVGMGAFILALYAVPKNFGSQSIPNALYISSIAFFGIVIISFISMIGYACMKMTEATFLRYVSQNVAYTSAIILKRAVKAKIDLGLVLVSALFLPLIYTMLKSILFFTDWNSTLVPSYRTNVHRYVPCYYMAFPPYEKNHINPETCPVASATGPAQVASPVGDLFLQSILSCDSYWGLVLYSVSVSIFVLGLTGYFYMYYWFIRLTYEEFRYSRWVDILDKLVKIRDEELEDYCQRFSWLSRMEIKARYELAYQIQSTKVAAKWMVSASLAVVRASFMLMYRPLRSILTPIIFLIDRLLIVSCLNVVFDAREKGRSNNRKTPPRRSLKLGRGASSKSLNTYNSQPGTGHSLNRAQSMRSTRSGGSSPLRRGQSATIGLETEFSGIPDTENDLTMWNISGKFANSFATYTDQVNPIMIAKRNWDRLQNYLYRSFISSRPIVYLRLQWNLFWHDLLSTKNNKNNKEDEDITKKGYGFAHIGGEAAKWRQDLTLPAKTKLTNRLKQHVVAELRLSKSYFISEHELILSFLDYTIDSAGLMTLFIPFSYTMQYWFLVIMLEMAIYAILGATLQQYATWQDRSYAILAFDVIFGILTYIMNPYTEEMDRWFEFSGRIMVAIVALGLPICDSIAHNLPSQYPVEMYAPWHSFVYISRLLHGEYINFGLIIDILMVIYFYAFVCSVLESIGFFRTLDRTMKAIIYTYHDHILDFLVEKCDERTFGFENIFSGMEFIQQWDEIIKIQRRYALLTWPDVRPPHLTSFFVKLFEIKWASLFNLTINNLRSSLGLTLLHTAMFSAESEIARWIIHTNPDLLLVPDSQNDTPITIALKECAYYLLVYGEQNAGHLDDNTSYSDESYNQYYPEVDDIRDEIFLNGEFIPEQCSTLYLTAKDLILLKETGVYHEPTHEVDEEKELEYLQTLAKDKLKATVDMHRKIDDFQRSIKIKTKKEKIRHSKTQRDRTSLTQKRFPEDDMYDDFESSETSAWHIMGFDVPQDNIYLDNRIMKKIARNANYHYHIPETRSKLFNFAANDPHNSGKVDEEEGSIQQRSIISSEPSSGVLAQWIDKDMQYVIPTLKRVHYVQSNVIVPLTHPALKDCPDWDRKRRKRRSSSHNNTRNNNNDDDSSSKIDDSHTQASFMTGSIDDSDQRSVASGSTIMTSLTTYKLSKQQSRETKWKICKFAEILMSREISEGCQGFKWPVNDFKMFNKLASVSQGKIAQHLAMVCHLNPPAGFVRVSDWSVGLEPEMFDERPDTDLPMIVKGIVTIVGAVETLAATAKKVVETVTDVAAMDLKRGRARRSRKSSRSQSFSAKSLSAAAANKKSRQGNNVENENDLGNASDEVEGMLSDRVVHFLAEALVCSTNELDLTDCELSYNGRRAWRAICRALRKKHCSFIIPSLFVPPKQIMLIKLKLARNEFDCGDCIYLSDVLMRQQHLSSLDLSFNRIGSRGMSRLCKALRTHVTLAYWKMDHNIIGPGAGQEIGLLLKANTSLQILDISFNHLGEIIRFPTLYTREKLPSAAHALAVGLKSNTSLQSLDISYNHMGPELADSLHYAINRHPCLHTLNISGNDVGPEAGTKLLFYLAGNPFGMKYAKERDDFIRRVKQSQTEDINRMNHQQDEQSRHGVYTEDSLTISTALKANDEKDEYNIFATDSMLFGSDDNDSTRESQHQQQQQKKNHQSMVTSSITGNNNSSSLSPTNMKKPPQQRVNPNDEKQHVRNLTATFEKSLQEGLAAVNLTSLSMADNQLGAFSGHAVASLIDRIKSLTYLDLSGNSLGPIGGERIADQLELMYGIKPREFLKIVLWEIEEGKYSGRNAKKRKKIYTNLTALNLSRNNLGPRNFGSLMISIANHNCGIVKLEIGDNPLGSSATELGGNASLAAIDIRRGLEQAKSLVDLNLARTKFVPVDLVTIFGGLAHHESIQKLNLEGVTFDEPSCLQLGNVLEHCITLTYLNVKNCRMGANGGLIIALKISNFCTRLKYVDMTGNFVGPVAGIYLGEAIKHPECSLITLRLAGNTLMEEGGSYVARAMTVNASITDLDLSNNQLNEVVAVYVAEAARGLFRNGIKVRDSALKRLVINDNPDIGFKGSKFIVKSVTNEMIEHFEMANIGAGPAAGNLIASALRDQQVAWSFLNISSNKIARIGLNQIFWAARVNKRLRVLSAAENAAGTVFCTNEDALLRHGISVPVAIRANFCLRELDLSFNSLTSEAGVNILDAIIDNHSLKKLSLRGNLFDDEIAQLLPDLFKCNNVLEELDLGQNRMAFSCAYAIAEALESNRSLRVLQLDYNRFGGSGAATLESFARSLMMNYSLQVLNLDGNKLGPEWGIRLGESFCRNNVLVQVSLRDNRLDSRAGLTLLQAYRNAKYLLELALTADEIGFELWEQFRVVFHEKRASVDPETLWHETKLTESQSHLLETYKMI